MAYTVAMQRSSQLLETTPNGLYCRAADVYLDPWKPVRRALITHAHADHARPGSEHYLTHHTSVSLLHARLGTNSQQVQGIEYGEVTSINGVNFTFHPAGHVPGSAQIEVEHGGERWVFSGDYKTEADGVSTPFEPVRCDVFISECTFGLPVYRWRPQQEIFEEIHEWWRTLRERGESGVLCAYSLGKAQRLLKYLRRDEGKILVHSAVWSMCEALGFDMQGLERATADTRAKGVLVVAPPAVASSPWLKRFGPYSVGGLSGWMAIRGIKRRRGFDAGFVLSDHADFQGLTSAVRATGASRVLLTHGYTAQFAKWLSETGIQAQELGTHYGEEEVGAE
jgi:putative mRNA 3-end processing factor